MECCPMTSPGSEEEDCKEEKTVNDDNGRNLQSIEELNGAYIEYSEAFNKLKQCLQFHKAKSFLVLQPLIEHVKQADDGVQKMGNVFKKELGNKFECEIGLAAVNDEDLQLSNHSPDHSDTAGKTNSPAGITPPASEVGNDEVLATALKTTSSNSSNNNNKRRSSNTSEPFPKSKKPRRTLLDDYLCKKEKKENKTHSEEEEFEVQNIIDLKKCQGELLYHVTWKGYSPDDSTWEPSSNLTSCEDLLVDFFKSRLRLREANFGSTLYYDPSIKNTIHKAVREYYCEPSRLDYKNQVTVILSSKTPAVSSVVDINDLIEKAFLTKKREIYVKHIKQIQMDIVWKDIKEKREIQLAELRKWERKINSICSDPAKLVVENNVDLEMPPKDFIYINECCAGEGVTLPSDPPVGCDCENCSTSKSCCASQMGSWTPYTRHGKIKVTLGTAIYECNKRCSCNSSCSNRVVQKGRTISLCIFRTANGRGWGVKAMEPIKKDSLVTEYVGEVITSDEAERRGKIYDAQKCTYLFDLDYDKGDQNPYTVDAAKFGNVSHFINHSCDPNLVVYNVWVNCLDPDLPRLALFALRDIKRGEEVTFDYNLGLETEGSALREAKPEDFNKTPEKGKNPQDSGVDVYLKTPKGNRGLKYGKTHCRCGAANCRQYFF